LVDEAVDNSEYQALERRNLELEEELRKLKAVLDGLRAEIKVEPGQPTLSTCKLTSGSFFFYDHFLLF
jgi:hypothetical protein